MSESQRTENTVKGNRSPYTGSSFANGLDSAIDNALASKIQTAELVKVNGVTPGGPKGPAGYVDCSPMVNDTDSFGEAVPGADLSHVPYMRLQCGKMAIVIDPEPGDIGLVVFTKADASNVGQGAEKPVQPASLRTFDAGNGFFVGPFLNKAPEGYIELNKAGEINIKNKVKISLETEGEITMKAASIKIDGPLTSNGGMTMVGGIQNSGGTISSNGKVLDTHTHPGDSGGVTGGPN